MAIQPPDRGFIFWPVGTGDSTTIRLAEDVYIQIDVRQTAKSEGEEETAWPVIDELIEILPTVDGEPFLSVFALTHPDQDHCQGFEDLNDRVLISELWMSPRTFREYRENEDLCEDAEAFHEEAMRRVEATIAADGDPGSGDRIRIIGYDDLLEESEFDGFPKDLLSIPGETITMVDGEDRSDVFTAFVHAPYKDDSYGERNDCSLSFQISLFNAEGSGQAMLMGDLKYPIIRRIFNLSKDEALAWNVLLAPHHCSKSVMYWQDDDEDEETLKGDIVTDMGNCALGPGFVVSSSMPIPATNKPGDNPPHAKAKEQYELIVPDEFLCTHQHKDEENPEPIVFEVTEDGFSYVGEQEDTRSMRDALKASGVGAPTAKTAVGFGRGNE